MVQLTVFLEFFAVVVFAHHAHTPAVRSATYVVAPTR